MGDVTATDGRVKLGEDRLVDSGGGHLVEQQQVDSRHAQTTQTRVEAGTQCARREPPAAGDRGSPEEP